MRQISIKIVLISALLCTLSLSLKAVLNCATYDSKNCITCNEGYTLIEDSIFYQHGTIYYCVQNQYIPQNCSPSLTGQPYIYENDPNLYQINLNAGDVVLLQAYSRDVHAQVSVDIELYYEGYASSNELYCACASTANSLNGFQQVIYQTGSYYIYIALKDTNTPSVFTIYNFILYVNRKHIWTVSGKFPTDTVTYHQFQCAVCDAGYILKTDVNGQNTCVSTINSCDQFATDSTQLNAKCIKCNLGWVLNFQLNMCIPLVQFCSHYNIQKCVGCIDNYILINSACVQTPSNCLNYSSLTGVCLNCSTGYVLNSNNQCDIDLSCPNYQYRNLLTNSCINGSISNCKTYFSSGLCQECESNYQIDSLGYSCLLIPLQITCPNNTSTYIFVVISQNCTKVNINCKSYREDGYCYNCMNGFYQLNGKCYSNNS